jgi:predicted nuclease of restriction endonuclease-like (RecB) superfamily
MTYQELLKDIKGRIRQAQVKAAMSANAEMLMLYWDIGRMIDERQNEEGWGSGVIPRLANDIKNELTDIKGFSVRNLGRMVSFYREYKELAILPTPLAKLPDTDSQILPTTLAQIPQDASASESPILPTALAKLRNAFSDNILRIPWSFHVAIIESIKDNSTRLWYVQQAIEHGWTYNHLVSMIKSKAHARQGKATTNFVARLPAAQSALADELLKDPYIFDFLTLEEPFHENELEANLIQHLEKFLMELGAGFAFMGRQYHVEVGEHDFYIDLLFYHHKLRSFIVIELKKGAFKPEYAGKLNFYCAVVDDVLRHPQDNPTIGLILCQTKDRVLAEYALRTSQQPIGVSAYDLTRALPDELKSSLPSIEEIEAELGSSPQSE